MKNCIERDCLIWGISHPNCHAGSLLHTVHVHQFQSLAHFAYYVVCKMDGVCRCRSNVFKLSLTTISMVCRSNLKPEQQWRFAIYYICTNSASNYFYSAKDISIRTTPEKVQFEPNISFCFSDDPKDNNTASSAENPVCPRRWGMPETNAFIGRIARHLQRLNWR